MMLLLIEVTTVKKQTTSAINLYLVNITAV